jgi:hypothetical protein
MEGAGAASTQPMKHPTRFALIALLPVTVSLGVFLALHLAGQEGTSEASAPISPSSPQGDAAPGSSELPLMSAPREGARESEATPNSVDVAGLLSSVQTPDPSGMTAREKLDSLTTLHESFTTAMQASGPEVADMQISTAFVLATRSVATILREMGRADYGTPSEIRERGGLVLSPPGPDEWIFAADRARFRFHRGEFPAYDYVRDLIEPRQPAQAELKLHEWTLMVEGLFQEAVQRIGPVPPQSK